jgi:hypothetical protein
MTNLSTRSILTRFVLAGALFVGCNSTKKSESPTQTQAGGQTSVAPSGESAAKRDRALVRFLNADPSGTRYDLWFGETRNYTNVKYQRLTPYDELPASRAEFRLSSAGGDKMQPLATNSEGLSAGKRYTVIAIPKADGKLTLSVLEDDVNPPANGKAKLRVIHAAPNVGTVDVTRAGPDGTLFKGVHFDSATGYKDVDPMTTTLEVRSEGQKQTALTSNLNLASGKTYTIVLAGGSGKSRLEALPIEDSVTRAVSL